MSATECVCRITGRLQAFQFAATVRRPERREALLFLLYSIVEHGEEATAEELSRHLFGPGRVAITERLLAAAQRWDLVCESDGQWSLTDLGVHALRQRSILVPKDSVWIATVLDAGGVGHALVTLEEVPAARLQSAKDETISIKAKQQASSLLALLVGEATLPADGGPEAIVEEYPEPTAVLLSDTPVDVTWFPLAGRIQFGPKDWTTEAAWCGLPELLGAARPDLVAAWDQNLSALAVSADDLSVDALFSRRFTVESVNAHIDAMGPVDQIELSLPVRPIDSDDAGNWVARRAMALATQLQTESVWERTLSTAAADLQEFDPQLPTKRAVASRAKSSANLAAYWNLVAAADWRIS